MLSSGSSSLHRCAITAADAAPISILAAHLTHLFSQNCPSCWDLSIPLCTAAQAKNGHMKREQADTWAVEGQMVAATDCFRPSARPTRRSVVRRPSPVSAATSARVSETHAVHIFRFRHPSFVSCCLYLPSCCHAMPCSQRVTELEIPGTRCCIECMRIQQSLTGPHPSIRRQGAGRAPMTGVAVAPVPRRTNTAPHDPASSPSGPHVCLPRAARSPTPSPTNAPTSCPSHPLIEHSAPIIHTHACSPAVAARTRPRAASNT